MALFHLLILSIFFLSIQIHGFPSGAPTKACTSSMLPKHHHYTPQPLATSPITKFITTWNSDETISVEIESNQPIKGVFIQGRKPGGTEPLGTFINIPSETHLVQCPTGDGVTHNSPQKWTHLQLTWQKPASIKSGETIQFWATVVVDFKHFWSVKSIE